MGVTKQTPAFVAIRPHIKLFGIVQKEYDDTSTINKEHAFSAYYLNNRWDYVNMARNCVRSKRLLGDCHITPLRNNGIVDDGPFWFKVVQTRSDGFKLSPEEICDLFWKKLNKEGFSLHVLGMTFQEVTDNINFCIQEDKEHSVPVKVALGDVVLSCKKINKNKNRTWYGYKCLLTLDTGKFKKSVVNITRPRISENKKPDNVNKQYSVTTIKPLVVKTKTFTQGSLPMTANFR